MKRRSDIPEGEFIYYRNTAEYRGCEVGDRLNEYLSYFCGICYFYSPPDIIVIIIIKVYVQSKTAYVNQVCMS